MTKQTRILALAAAATWLAPLAASQGSSSTQIPDCVLQCRPWVVAPVTLEREVDCLAKEVEIELLIAAAAGDPYIPRFSSPGCTASGACPFGAETFTYETGDTIALGAGLWSTATSFWLGGPGSVVQVDVHVAPVTSIVGATDMSQLPWQRLPTPHFDPIDGFWRIAWDTTGFDDPAGYFLRVDMLDSALGPINAYTLGVDAENCGFHTYGELVGGANKLELSAVGEACAGETAVLTTKQTTATEVFTSVALAGDYVPLLLGTVFVDLSSQVFVFKTPTVAGVAQEEVLFPSNPALAGLSITTQSLAFEPAAPMGVVFSNALRIDFCSCP